MMLAAALLAVLPAAEPAQPAAVPAPGSARTVTSDVLPKVVKIFGSGGLKGLPSYGTGFLISSRGHVATVWNHVLDSDTNILVVLDDGRRLNCEMISGDPARGLAVLKPDRDDLNLPFFDPAAFAVAEGGDRVLAFSNAYKVAGGDEPVAVQRAVVAAVAELDARSGRNAAGIDGPVLILDAPTNNPGAAGGPVVGRDGSLVGVLGRELKNEDTAVYVNYAMPAAELGSVLTAMMSDDFKASDTALPVIVGGPQPVDLGALLVPDVVRRTPAYVELVEDGSPGAAAGLLTGDLIVLVDGDLVPSIRDLIARLALAEPGEPLDLVVRRGAELIPLTVTIPEAADLRDPPKELDPNAERRR